MTSAPERTLIAGVGNIFLSDDGFGSEVAARLVRRPLPPGAEVVDIGIRGVHLAYQLLDGYDRLVLVDALPHGEPPGTVYLLEPDRTELDEWAAAASMDAHSLDPGTVIGLVRQMGGEVGHVLVVGCEPATVADGIGLSAEVEAAVERAIDLIVDLLDRSKGASRARAGHV